MPEKSILLLGTRGIPASHGGFKTFVERLAPYLVQQGWDVSVYCQEGGTQDIWEDNWHGVRRIHVPVSGGGSLSTIKFDWVCMRDAVKRPGLLLSFGYPTPLFALLPRLKRRRHVINMDGVEWKRSQFGKGGKAWLYINERIAALLVEALGAGNAILAMNNDLNSWVAGKGATYFIRSMTAPRASPPCLPMILSSPPCAQGRRTSLKPTGPAILARYEALLLVERP